jgi:phosphohistidine phosphatase
MHCRRAQGLRSLPRQVGRSEALLSVQPGAAMAPAGALRRVVLLHHAQAEPPQATASDRERSLTAMGKAQASRIGAILRASRLLPDAVVSSPAPRALQTAKAAVQATRYRIPIHQDPLLYEGGTQEVLECIERHALGPTVWVVGHNPGLQEAGILLGDLWGTWRLHGACAAVFEVEQRPLGLGAARLRGVFGMDRRA